MKHIIYRLLLLTFVSSLRIGAYFEFRSPLWMQRPHSHYELCPVQHTPWFDLFGDGRYDETWQIDSWITTYTRSASKAYWNPTENKNTRKTAPLSALFFNSVSFRGEESFVGGQVSPLTQLNPINGITPLIGSAFISPVMDFNERGSYFGVMFDKTFGCDNQWHGGMRTSIPFVVVEVKQDWEWELEETLEDLVRYRSITDEQGTVPGTFEFAYRMDFVSTLSTAQVQPDGTIVRTPLLTRDANGLIKLGASALSGAASTDAGIAAYVTKESTGTFPPIPYRKTPTQASTPLAADGSGTDNTSYFFKTTTDYTNLLKDRTTLSTLFLVPRADENTDHTPGALTSNANNLSLLNGVVGDAIFPTQLVDGGLLSVTKFFVDHGINFIAYERVVGLGDLEAEGYIGYGCRQHWFVDAILGFRFPTGTKDKNPQRLYYLPTGHNDHFEVKIEFEGGWKPCDYFALKADVGFHHVFRHTEKRNVHFTGATINNVGPTVDTKVSWNYYIAHVDFNFFHPFNKDVGFMIGYEFYGRTKDHLSYEVTTATDAAGQTGTLDAEAAERRTNTMSHKIRGELFHRWNYFEIDLGLSQIIGGRSVMRETEAHIGFNVYF